MAITDLPSLFFSQLRTAEEEAGRVYEAVIGIVTDIKDPDKLFRVKVKLPTISATDNTWWAPVISEGAGKDRGWFFLPEVDDEVLVIFEHGDIHRPLVIGAIWGGKDKPPESNSGSNPKRVMVSRAKSRIEFDDEGGKIIISDGGGKGKITIDSGANKITIEALQGDVCIQSPKGDNQSVTKDTAMEGQTGFEAVSQQGIKIGSDDAVNLKGSGMLQVSGATVNLQNGSAQAPQAPTASPEEAKDPAGG